MSQFKQAEQQLRSLLIGEFYSGVLIDDGWSFRFGDIWLVAQEISAPEEQRLLTILQAAAPLVMDGTDPQYITKGILALRSLRQPVTELAIADDGALTLHFEPGKSLIYPADTAVVDWQWAVNRSGQTPYVDFIVACFGQGEIQTNAL
ncbi:MAG: hypothetical protein H7330_10395 [Hymenobacteraceae bacterium]|nr:hypothetical protein [Hymenobacteraceae bacterium]